MPRCRVGTVQVLWRYPVKSLRGESLDSASITGTGVAGDRVWALRELDRGGIMSARTWAAMLALRATWQGDPTNDPAARVCVELPGGRTIYADDPDASRILSQLFRREIRLERIRTERMTPQELDAVMRGDAFPPRRDFFDEDVMHLIASGTLEHLRGLRPGSDFDPRRFRANVYIDTGAGSSGFIEDQWLDGVLEIGESARVAGMRPSIRCAVTTHAQADLPRDVAILRAAWELHQAYVGVFASVAEPGEIRVGDSVVLAT